jgi:Tfp pilus assembly protein PilO
MKKNMILALALLVYAAGFWLFYTKVIEPQPRILYDLRDQLAEKTRQHLSAQIISKNLENVNELIENNLVENLSDSLAQSASIPFLNYLTSLMDDIGIVLISMKPAAVVRWDQTSETKLIDQDYIEIPYDMSIIASYEQIGKFLENLEKSPRLIKVARIQILNPTDFAYYEGEISGRPDQHRINLIIHTMTILKASFEGGSEQSI